MIPHFGESIATIKGFPRVSGDDPRRRHRCQKRQWFSPRERG